MWLVPVLAVLLSLWNAQSFSGYRPTESAVEWFYLFVAPLGHWMLLSFLFLLPALLLALLSPYIGFVLGGVITAGLMCYAVIDALIYRIYQFHVNPFLLEVFFSDGRAEFFDISPLSYVIGAVVFVLLSFAAFFMLRHSLRWVQRATRPVVGVFVFMLCVSAVVAPQLLHAAAWNRGWAAITRVTPMLPLFYPLRASAISFDELAWADEDLQKPVVLDASTDATAFKYPRQPMMCSAEPPPMNVLYVVLESWRHDMLNEEVMPNVWALAQKNQWFENHFANSNVTTTGVFSMFYGISPTNWDAVNALGGVGGPVLMQTARANGYDFSIMPSGDIFRIRLADTVFSGIDVDRNIDGEAWERDLVILGKFDTFAENHNPENPFLGAVFLDASHHRYSYPDDFEEAFQPAQPVEIFLMQDDTDPVPYLNRYKNSLRFVDQSVGNLIDSLESNGLLDNTVVVITGDHGEEFNETGQGYWGHGSNFSNWQTSVPLVVLWPGMTPQKYTHRTAHVDIPATLTSRVMGCQNPIEDFSVGHDLFQEAPVRVLTALSYYNFAFVTEDRVYEATANGVTVRSLAGELLDEPPASSVLKKGFKVMQHFQP